MVAKVLIILQVPFKISYFVAFCYIHAWNAAALADSFSIGDMFSYKTYDKIKQLYERGNVQVSGRIKP